ncbi:MAG: hypothetical protein ACOH1J_09000 [Microbacteriaceae bacterium]
MFSRPTRLIIAQYSPPADLSLVAAAELLGDGKRAIAAQLIDFAVRKVITIARPEGRGKRSGFTITLQSDGTGEGPDERAILSTLFGDPLAPGATVMLNPKRNRELGTRLKHPHAWISARLVAVGLARQRGLIEKIFTPWRKEPIAPTPAAFPLVDHLWGVHDYVRLAEKDRLSFLQSPDGALRRKPLNNLEVLVLNEKLLPFAVLFGLEKQWMTELDLQYRSLPPEAVAALGDLLLLTEFALDGVDLLIAVVDIADVVDVVDVADGVGAIFGGIGEFLGDL